MLVNEELMNPMQIDLTGIDNGEVLRNFCSAAAFRRFFCYGFTGFNIKKGQIFSFVNLIVALDVLY